MQAFYIFLNEILLENNVCGFLFILKSEKHKLNFNLLQLSCWAQSGQIKFLTLDFQRVVLMFGKTPSINPFRNKPINSPLAEEAVKCNERIRPLLENCAVVTDFLQSLGWRRFRIQGL